MTQREIKFRVWDKIYNRWLDLWQLAFASEGKLMALCDLDSELYGLHQVALMQYTGLKDKQTLTDIYEGDIIDMEGNIRGNIYESPEIYKTLTTSVVAGMGYEDWEIAKQRLVRQGKLIAEQSNLPQILRELG